MGKELSHLETRQEDLVSIIMPSYNAEKYIENAINSVLQQTYEHWELLIVDDRSSDRTVEIISDFSDDRIRFFQNETNCGAAISRNRALREAKGRWIAFLDSDDIWHPEKLERQLSFMRENHYAFTFTDYRIQLNGEWLPYVNTGPDVVDKRKMYNYCYFSTITVMYDRDVVGLIQIEDLKKNNDYAMWLQAVEKTKCYRLPECLSYYIKHEDSVSSGSKLKLIKWHYILFRKGLHKSVPVSVILTVNNLVHGVIKKLKYKEQIAGNKQMTLYEKLIDKEENLALVGLGYVGMPIAIAFAKKGLNVIGFDLNQEKIDLYKSGVDPTLEVGNEVIGTTTVRFTSDEEDLKKAKFIVVAVPTPVNTDHTPDLTPVIGASEIVGRNLTKASYVVFESTVYPGCTEDICIPILEKGSGLKCGVDFKVGYSPERINPGDKVHRLENIKKIVSGCDDEALQTIKAVYDIVIEAGTYPVSNLRTAEAVKIAENSQRDINIAFMNELAMVFDKMDIDTNEVVDGMNTKWNALGFRPGLVGGHCIGVDPYYFTYQAEKLGYHSQIILNGRIVNDSVGAYVADAAVKKMVEAGQAPKKSKVAILGLTFKENCPDTRNSKVADIIKQLNTYGIDPIVVDAWASEHDAMREYGVTLTKLDDVSGVDCVIVAVAHNEFKAMSMADIKKLFRDGADEEKVLIDVKGLYKIDDLRSSGLRWWRL